MPRDSRRYIQIVTFRVVLAVFALLIAARAGHQSWDNGPAWLLTSILATGASACLIWPLVVPARNRTMSVYSVAPAFFLAGMLLIPPSALVLATAFAILLSGVVHGARAYRTVFQLSASIIAFGGFGILLSVGPSPSDLTYQPALRVGLEILIALAALVTLLLVRSVALRVELGEETPHWGAFQQTAVVEAVLCLVFSISITILARIHLALLAVVFAEIGAIWWFLHRYHGYVSGSTRASVAEVIQIRPASTPALRRVRRRESVAVEETDRWKGGTVRKIR